MKARHLCIACAILLACSASPGSLISAEPQGDLVSALQERLPLNERQVRGALGALLIYARERLPKNEFDALMQSVPNADVIMQEVKLQGIVTRPLDTIDDYEEALSHLGIGQSLASQFPQAVVEALSDAGHEAESDILSRILD